MSNTAYLYVGSTMCIVLVIFLILQTFAADRQLLRDPSRRTVLVKTPKGLVAVDNTTTAKELIALKRQILDNSAGACSGHKNLKPKIHAAMKNLAKFIQDNPSDNSAAICNLDLRTNLIDQSMADSITPEASDYDIQYKSILEWESHEREMPSDPQELLEYLIKNIDIAIGLLRADVCDSGHLDLQALHDILLDLVDQICQSGSMHDPAGQQIAFGYDPYSRYNRPPPQPLFLLNQHTIEPFESMEVGARSMPKKGSFGKIGAKPVHSGKPMSGFSGKLWTDDTLQPTDDFSGTVESVEVGDRSFEGSVERDILGYKPPGHIMAQLYNSSDHYTVNVNACGGKYASDADLMKECVTDDLSFRMALNGNAGPMLDCIGNCDQEPNYMREYHKINNAIEDMSFIQGTEGKAINLIE